MGNKGALTKTLAVVGTVLAWVPFAAVVATSVPDSLRRGAAQVDYLIPEELFPIALVAGGLLLWAALRARSRVAPIAWSFGGIIAMLVGGMALAVVTGLASGATEPTGPAMIAVAVTIALYCLALAVLGVAGILLGRDVFSS